MAARQNQGLHIALIIFVMLTITLTVATFIFASKLKEERLNVQAKAEALTKEEEAHKVTVGDFAEVMKKLGHETTATADKEAVLKEFNTLSADLAALAVIGKQAMAAGAEGDPAAKKIEETATYPAFVRQLLDALAFRDGRFAEVAKAKNEIEAKMKANEVQAKAKEDTLVKSQDAALKEREKVKADSDAQIAAATKAKDEVQTAAEGKSKEFDTSLTDLQGKVKAREDSMKKIATERDTLAIRVKSSAPKTNEVADGQVTWISARERVVYVNLGRADFLRPQVTFSVFPADVNDLVNSTPKAKIEVTRVVGDHEAECRIVEDSITNPILPSDKIFSPVFHPGRKIHFAIAGKTDIDGDGNSDRAKVKQLIEINGGVVDAEVTDDGKLEGALSSATTRYILIGERPTDVTGKAILEKYTQIVAEAKQKGVAEMNIQQFLDMMGYKTDEKTVNLGRGADPRDFRAKDSENATRKTGVSPKFRDRQAPGRGTNGAY